MKIYSLLHSVSKYIQYPELLKLRVQGVTASQYCRYGQQWIRRINPSTIFDIGANIGQSAVAFHALFPSAKIYSFEPIPSCFDVLQLRTKGIPNIHSFNIGLGEFVGLTEFELNEFPASSSFLPLADAHKNVFGYAQKTISIKVNVDRLDNFIPRIDICTPIMMKIDVQGFEDKVLKGAESLVKKSSILIIETSFKTLYHGQPLFNDVYEILRSWGFQYVGSVENMYHPDTHEILQSDCVFYKP